MNGEAFDEYDEQGEAMDESFEAMDEADEGYDESDEGYDESDEAMEASDESDEALDESDEALDEADSSLSTRMRLAQDRARQQAWRSQVANTLRADMRRANSAQATIARQIRSINVGGRARSASVPAVRGHGVVRATLRNGKTAEMMFEPKLAPLSEVNRLRAALAYNDRQQAAALATQRKAIANLASAQKDAATRLGNAQVKSDKDLSEKIVQSYNKLDSRISNELNGRKGIIEKNNRKMMRFAKEQQKRQLLNTVTVASSLPLFAAYGDRSDPFSKNNLILAGSLGGWLLLDEFVDVFLGRGKGGSAKAWSGAANAWSWIAPAGNVLTGHFLLKDKQHDKVIAKVNTVAVSSTGVVDLPIGIGKDSLEDFTKLTTKPTAVASLVSSTAVTSVKAEVVPNAVGGPVVRMTFAPAPAAGASESVTVAFLGDARPTN